MNAAHSVQMMQMITSGIAAQSIGVAAELGIADLLSERPQTAAEIASATGVDGGKLYRLLRFLASLGIFQIGPDEAWSLTPLGEVLRADVPGSVRAGARLMERISSVTPYLRESIRTGECAYNLAYGKSLFEDLSAKPEDAAVFDAAMTSFHGGETEAVLDAYSFEGVSTLADIGGGNGAVLIATLQRYTSMKGILFDQGHVLERTARIVRDAGLSDRCALNAGDFFETIPGGADVYTMRHILHDWSDELCVRILKNIREIIPASGRLLVIETVVPEGNEPSPSKLFDILMMMFPNGMERSEGQFRAIFTASGFTLAGITPTASPVSVIEARPV